MSIPDIPEGKTKAGPGVVVSCRIPEEFSSIITALNSFCEARRLKRNWVIATAIVEYLKAHGGAK